MDELKQLIAANLAAFRKANHLTQAELAEKINYSDKVISKWERGESTPDVLILHQLAEIYGVTVDRFLMTDEQAASQAADALAATQQSDEAPPEEPARRRRRMDHNQRIIVVLSIILVWFIAMLGFVICWGVTEPHVYYWYAFMCAVPVSLVVWLVLNSIWGIVRNNVYIISLLIWSVLLTVFFGLWERRLWLIFLLGIPAQLAAVLSFGFRLPIKKTKAPEPEKVKEEKSEDSAG